MSKAKQKGAGGGNLGSYVLLIGFVLFAVSWFVPTYQGQDLHGALTAIGEKFGIEPKPGLRPAPDWLPGWDAFRLTWKVLTADDPTGGHIDHDKQLTLGSTCLTNGVMLLAMLLAAMRRCGLGCGLVLLGCAALDASWIYLGDQNPFDIYRAGYFLWLGSFAIAGVGALMRARQD